MEGGGVLIVGLNGSPGVVTTGGNSPLAEIEHNGFIEKALCCHTSSAATKNKYKSCCSYTEEK